MTVPKSEYGHFLRLNQSDIATNDPMDTSNFRDKIVNNTHHLYTQAGQVRLQWIDADPVFVPNEHDNGLHYMCGFGPFPVTMLHDGALAPIISQIEVAWTGSMGSGSVWTHLRREGESYFTHDGSTTTIATRPDTRQYVLTGTARSWLPLETLTKPGDRIGAADRFATKITGSDTALSHAEGYYCYLDIYAKMNGGSGHAGLWIYSAYAQENIAQTKPLLNFLEGTFSRASSGSYFYEDTSTLEWWRPNELRKVREYTPEGSHYFLFEGSTTNFRTRAEEINNGWTSSSAQVTANSRLAPDRQYDADYVYYTAFDGNVRAGFGNADGPWTMSVFAATSSATKEFRQTFLKADGTEALPYGHYTASIDWQRFAFSVADIGDGASSCQTRFLNSGTFNEGLFLWGMQAETGSFPTSYISASNASATRAADSLHFLSGAGPWVNQPWHFYLKPESGTDDSGLLQNLVAINSTNPDYVRFTAERDRLQVGASGSVVCDTSASLTYSRLDQLRIGLDPPNGIVTIQGATSGNGTYYGVPWTWATDAKIQFGASVNVTGNYFGLMSEPMEGI